MLALVSSCNCCIPLSLSLSLSLKVENSQRLVECLQEDLASSQGRCDGLQQAVSSWGMHFERSKCLELVASGH